MLIYIYGIPDCCYSVIWRAILMHKEATENNTQICIRHLHTFDTRTRTRDSHLDLDSDTDSGGYRRSTLMFCLHTRFTVMCPTNRHQTRLAAIWARPAPSPRSQLELNGPSPGAKWSWRSACNICTNLQLAMNYSTVTHALRTHTHTHRKTDTHMCTHSYAYTYNTYSDRTSQLHFIEL